ncbi:MAG: M20/M25/M40 family metallo-hydrolase [Caldilineaceae bacterium SB0670_bin_27]|uniref:M20/M25/M40 family metallo-hydrolase n=1 Tax=Caldilineaceae bacterium SB0664_bin_27 TaxID=2605260 RepID=A0A6B0YZ45_9CHLR|nr:M20/M25/M40 family metallo-hydrolase [Caldilineaceae bacterium SB0664_bin_27]MYJ79475.1 M20/M25/M40 family metallo-hydrolase [Caldilineaceae bacterium SB0670_bin_27]
MLIDRLSHGSAVQAAAAAYAGRLEQLIDLCVAVQQIPAPTGAETERAAWIESRMQAIGLADVARDRLGNVYGRVRSRRAQDQPALLVSAHTDTVFPSETDLRLRRLDNGLIRGPGIGDNSTGVAGLLTLAETLIQLAPPPVDIWLVANSMEEGVGDLRGMRRVVDRLAAQTNGANRNAGPSRNGRGALGAVIVLEGMGLGRIVHQALGVRRYRTSAAAPGGHSWGDFGAASAVHGLVSLAEEMARVQVPQTPRTSFNIGRIGGGTSINTIAQQAWMELDLRSESPETLAWLDGEIGRIVERHAQAHRAHGDGLTLQHEQIGNRPPGGLPFQHPLVQAASTILQELGVKERSDARISSTDANVPLSRNIPAVCVGLTDGGDAHRLSEWIDPMPLVKGMQQLLYLTWWSAAWLTSRG